MAEHTYPDRSSQPHAAYALSERQLGVIVMSVVASLAIVGANDDRELQQRISDALARFAWRDDVTWLATREGNQPLITALVATVREHLGDAGAAAIAKAVDPPALRHGVDYQIGDPVTYDQAGRLDPVTSVRARVNDVIARAQALAEHTGAGLAGEQRTDALRALLNGLADVAEYAAATTAAVGAALLPAPVPKDAPDDPEAKTTHAPLSDRECTCGWEVDHFTAPELERFKLGVHIEDEQTEEDGDGD